MAGTVVLILHLQADQLNPVAGEPAVRHPALGVWPFPPVFAAHRALETTHLRMIIEICRNLRPNCRKILPELELIRWKMQRSRESEREIETIPNLSHN